MGIVTKKLRALIARDRMVSVVGAYDALSARLHQGVLDQPGNSLLGIGQGAVEIEQYRDAASPAGHGERDVIHETAQDVLADPRHVVVVAVVRQAARPGDGAHGEHRTTAGRFKKRHISAHVGILGTVHGGMVEAGLVGHQIGVGRMTLRGRQDQGVGRGAEHGVGGVDLGAAGAAEM